MVIPIDMNIVITYSLSVLVTIHCLKFRGIYKTLLLFFGSVIIGGGLENANSIFGGYFYPGSDLTLFVGKCPFDVILGWYVILYCCSYFSHAIVGKNRGSYYSMGIGTKPTAIDKKFIGDAILRAALAGYLAIVLDFLIDPVAVVNEWWIWQIENIYVLEVPIGNYLGWWSLIFWASFFYDMITTSAGIKEFKQLKTSILWMIFTIVACFLTGFLLIGSNAWWGIEGIKTEGLNTHAFDYNITPVMMEGIIVALIMIAIAMGAILLSSFAPDKFPEPRPTQYIWRILPSIIMLLFWGLVMVIAALTSAELVAIGVIYCIPYLVICIYLIFRPCEFPTSIEK